MGTLLYECIAINNDERSNTVYKVYMSSVEMMYARSPKKLNLAVKEIET